MKKLRELADELNFKISDTNTFDENSDIIEGYLKQAYDLAIEDAVRVVHKHPALQPCPWCATNESAVRELKDVKK